MTDGAAKLAEVLLEGKRGLVREEQSRSNEHSFLRKVYEHTTSRDPATFWTSGQWMTERGGGSDVQGGTNTKAIPITVASSRAAGVPVATTEDHLLTGYKWFSSAADGEVSITLARIRRVKPLSSNRSSPTSV